MTISNLLAVTLSISTTIGAIAAVIYASRRNTSDIDEKNISSLEKRVQLVEQENTDLKKRVFICEDRHAKNNEERGKMQGQLDTYLAILKDRNPETEKFMAYLTKVAAASEQAILEAKEKDSHRAARDEKIVEALNNIGDFLSKLNSEKTGTVEKH